MRGRIKGAGVPIYAIWHCTLGLPSANMRVNEISALPARASQCQNENSGMPQTALLILFGEVNPWNVFTCTYS